MPDRLEQVAGELRELCSTTEPGEAKRGRDELNEPLRCPIMRSSWHLSLVATALRAGAGLCEKEGIAMKNMNHDIVRDVATGWLSAGSRLRALADLLTGEGKDK